MSWKLVKGWCILEWKSVLGTLFKDLTVIFFNCGNKTLDWHLSSETEVGLAIARKAQQGCVRQPYSFQSKHLCKKQFDAGVRRYCQDTLLQHHNLNVFEDFQVLCLVFTHSQGIEIKLLTLGFKNFQLHVLSRTAGTLDLF